MNIISGNKQIHTWGTGKYGELGTNCILSNVPVPINLGRNMFINKIQCGDTYTAFLNCNNIHNNSIFINLLTCSYNFLVNRNVFFIGKILKYSEYIEEFDFSTKLNYINDFISFDNIIAGHSVICLIDNQKKLYLYNEKDKLISFEKEIREAKQVKFIHNNFYVLNTSKDLLYEFSVKNRLVLSIKDYTYSVYRISEKCNMNIINIPYYSNNLFYIGGKNNKIKQSHS